MQDDSYKVYEVIDVERPYYMQDDDVINIHPQRVNWDIDDALYKLYADIR